MATRNERGQFVKGHPGGPGRPRREVEQEYQSALVGKVKLSDWERIIARAVQDALGGDHNARVFLANYLVGRPQERLDVTSNDGPLTVRIVRDTTRTEVE